MMIVRFRKRVFFWGILLILGAGVLGLAACKSRSSQEEAASRMAEKAIKEQTGQEAKVDIQGGNVRIQIGDTSGEVRKTQEWSRDIPPEVPRFTMGKIQGVTTGEREGKKNWNIVIKGGQGGAPNAYLEALKAKGWKITATLTAGDKGSITAQKGNLEVMALFEGERQSAVITVVQK